MARRALLTETERERLSGEGEDQLQYQAKSKVKRRIREELPTDIQVLEQHPDLLDAVQEIVCEE
jgi:hypothetical protein